MAAGMTLVRCSIWVAPKIGEVPPALLGKDRKGDLVDLSQYRGKVVVVVSFWASWCGPCLKELPQLDLVAGDRPFARRSGRVCMSNSFAFGGSNASLLIGDAR